jgi:hypothetical protein
VKVELKMLPSEAVLQNHGLQEGSAVQKLVDSEAIRYMEPYTPMLNGALIKSATTGTVIGSGEIHQTAKYANYLHEGILYVSPTTGSAWAKKNEIKVPTDRELTYAGAPMRGKKWFERMKADHKDDILQAAQALVNRGGKV